MLPGINLGICYPRADGEEALVRRHLLAALDSEKADFAAPRPPQGHAPDVAALRPLLALEGVPAEIALTASGQSALAAALLTFCGSSGTHVAVEEWSFPNALNMLRRIGARISILPMDADGLRPEALEDACRAGARVLYTTPTVHNPTGITIPPDRRTEITAIVERFDMAVVEDEAYAFLEEDDVCPLQALAPERTIRMISLSKTLSLSLRLGAVVCPPPLIGRVVQSLRTIGGMANPVMTSVAARLVQAGAAEGLVAAKRREGRERQALARGIFREGYSAHPAGWYGMVDLNEGGVGFTERARRAGVILSPGGEYRADGADAASVRVSLGAEASRQRLAEGLAVVAKLRE